MATNAFYQLFAGVGSGERDGNQGCRLADALLSAIAG
jgi:hypothetical protein